VSDKNRVDFSAEDHLVVKLRFGLKNSYKLQKKEIASDSENMLESNINYMST